MNKKLTKVTIETEDKTGTFSLLQKWLTMKNDGQPVSQTQVMKWLLELGLKVKNDTSKASG